MTIPAMSNAPVLNALRAIGRDWQGRGCAVECGTWLGASLAALAEGLVEAAGGGYDRPLHTFDKWCPGQSEVRKAAAAGVTIRSGQDIRPLMLANVRPIYANIVTHRGNVQNAKWNRAEPIEILICDAAKRDPSFTATMNTFAPSIVPGGVLGLLDYGYYRRFSGSKRNVMKAQVRWVKRMGDAMEPIAFPGVVPSATAAQFFRVRAAMTR